LIALIVEIHPLPRWNEADPIALNVRPWEGSEMSNQDATRQAKGTITEMAQQAQDTISETADRVTAAAAATTDAVAGIARETGRRVGAAAESALGNGNAILDAMEGSIRENPWTALLIAGAAGYGISLLIHHR
jgi:ElaB/YqjD/DUF883 family membrane-anchored ribosome-binding protein